MLFRSSSCVIEYDGIYYWAGTDRFLMYNGVVAEVPNTQNFNYFFDNLNYVQRQKVWVSKVPRWGEIWWFFPSGDSTECNDAAYLICPNIATGCNCPTTSVTLKCDCNSSMFNSI